MFSQLLTDSRLLTDFRWITGLLALLTFSACPKQAPQTALATVGTDPAPDSWSTVNGHACYAPPDFAAIVSPSERRLARSKAYGEVVKRWQGEVDPSFAVKSNVLEELDASLMAYPDRIEGVLQEDFRQCQAFQKGTLSIDAYQAWFQSKVDTMAQQDCSHPPFELVTQYLEVNKRWQVETLLCQGEVVLIRTSNGEYTVEAKEKVEESVWITSTGDLTQPAKGTTLPCQEEGCFKGQVVGRFVDRQGKERVFPVGKQTFYSAPAHGYISFSVNDLELFDNRFRVQNQQVDYMVVEIFPAKKSEAGE